MRRALVGALLAVCAAASLCSVVAGAGPEPLFRFAILSDRTGGHIPGVYQRVIDEINLLNPAPYIFWSTVGGTYLLQNTLVDAAVFAILFLATLSITKFTMALSIKILGNRFSDKHIGLILKLLAVLLLYFAASLFIRAFSHL